MGGNPQPTKPFFKVALDQRIASILLRAEAESRGLGATPEEIDARMKDFRSRYKSDEEFEQALANNSMTVEKARDQFAQDLARMKYVEKVILPTIPITDEAMKKFYDENQDRMQQPERIKLRQILIVVPADATEEQRSQARQRAEAAQKRAKAGEDFKALAQEVSEDPTGKQGGELPWVAKGDLRQLPTFEQAGWALEKGQVSDVVETPAGFHVIQCMDRQAPRMAQFDEVKDRIHMVLQNQAAQEKLRTVVEELMGKAKIERFGI
jgi:peptidyl-prolyl cis-trans isomerase C